MLLARDLGFSFERRKILSQVSFRVEPGQLLHILGVNGAGKSTLLSILAGLLPCHEGEFGYFSGPGEKIEFFSPHIAYLAADGNGLYLSLDARANLEFCLALRGKDASQAAIDDSLRRWGLGHVLLRGKLPVRSYSTGMRRRLALARLSALNATCWLLDEPLLGLDSQDIATFAQELRQHLNKGGYAVLVSHDQASLAASYVQTLKLDFLGV